MPREKLTARADEQSTYVITLSVTDAEGTPVTPNTASWSLTTAGGSVINSRSAVTLTPAASMAIVLSGLDLAMQTGEVGIVERLVTVQATYSSTEGSNLPYKAEYVFLLYPLVAVT